MKISTSVSSSRRKARRSYFTAPSHLRRRAMSCRLSKELQKKYGVKTLPVRVNDEVTIVAGKHKETTGKVTSVFRKKYAIVLDKLTHTKANKQTVNIPIHPSQCEISKIYINNNRTKMLERRRSEARLAKE